MGEFSVEPTLLHYIPLEHIRATRNPKYGRARTVLETFPPAERCLYKKKINNGPPVRPGNHYRLGATDRESEDVQRPAGVGELDEEMVVSCSIRLNGSSQLEAWGTVNRGVSKLV